MVEELIRELIPHAPQWGLFVAPHIPEDRLRGALADYAQEVHPHEVLALYDATLMGTGRDGAVFLHDRFVFQNLDLEPAQTVRYEDLVGVELKRRWLGGRRIVLQVNRGRATFTLTLDFSGKPKAAPYVARFLQEAMLRAPFPRETSSTQTDLPAVQAALQRLRQEGKLSARDYERLLEVLRSG
ncbi:hypothetical protein [Rhodothermus profundi]|uniref:PH domain-containing protein n=1 Tax=Rhodothermus profundi TaxID=633813 RepID=A0A1M6WBI9_9BACT|nr:hypothetical protein [Rhodothermus profundi]SHK90998.1 hypothetical protein SAMN04488087_2262 [Rhodothermus profundi]